MNGRESVIHPSQPRNGLTVLMPIHNEADSFEQVIGEFRHQTALPIAADFFVCRTREHGPKGKGFRRAAVSPAANPDRGDLS